MIGGLKQTTSRLAIAAAAGLFMGGIALTPAQAADLGGDCCADLEERVAELEATTVRKGNRKVSVKLSGQVNRMILWWDDGYDSDVFFTDNENSNTRFRITGSAQISPGRTAGFKIEADWFIENNSSTVSNCAGGTQRCQPLANVVGNSLTATTDMRHQDIWIKDDKLGKVSLGKGDMASNGTSEVDLSGTSVILYAGMTDVGGNFYFRDNINGNGATQRLGAVYSQLDGASRRNRLRYDTPSIGGFTFSTSVSADDVVDGALRFKKEWNSVRCAAAAAFVHDTEGERNTDDWQYNGSASCIHTPSGLNLTGGLATLDRGDRVGDDQDWWFIKVGISRRWNSHGKTNIAAQYAEVENSALVGDNTEAWGVALVQNIDSAAMELYLSYRHFEYSDGPNAANAFEDLDFVTAGARIKF